MMSMFFWDRTMDDGLLLFANLGGSVSMIYLFESRKIIRVT